MSTIFITGSTDGLGLHSAKMLMDKGHEVIFHAKDIKRADELKQTIPDAKILVADLTDFEQVKALAKEVNALGELEAIIHNAGVFHSSSEEIFKVNVLAPYILTALINRPKKLIYIGSNMHPQGEFDIEELAVKQAVDYSTSKLMILMMSLAIARRFNDVYVNTVDPGWVKTKMANYSAPDSLEEGSATQVWLASEDVKLSGKYFYHLQETIYSSKANDIELQDELINLCEALTRVSFSHNNK